MKLNINTKSNPTIIDVAKLANTSKSTVSRFLNGQKVKKQTEEKLLSAIAQLNYHPNMNARNLATNQTMEVGVIVDNIDDDFYSAILSGIEVVMMSYGYECVFYSRKGNLKKESEYLDLLFEGKVDALILVSFRTRDKETMELINRTPYPIVLIGDGDETLFSINVDNYSGTFRTVEYLYNIGHQKIAFISGPEERSASHLRYKGYCAAIQTFNLIFNSEWIISSDWSNEGGYNAMMELLSPDLRGFTAVVASNDKMAIGALLAARERGFNIPTDFSITGFDDIHASNWVFPTLTTVNQPYNLMGRQAAEKLTTLLQGNEPEETLTLLKPKLIVRNSCMPLYHNKN